MSEEGPETAPSGRMPGGPTMPNHTATTGQRQRGRLSCELLDSIPCQFCHEERIVHRTGHRAHQGRRVVADHAVVFAI